MKDLCPVCKESKLTKAEINKESALCNECDINRFFQDDIREIEYRATVAERIAELKKLFKEDYNEVLHTDMVQQIVRCEIAMHRYEMLIANDEESIEISEHLKAERSHWNKLAEKLHMTIKSIRGDTKNIKHEFSDDFKTYLGQILEGDVDEKLPEEEEEKRQ